uniref:Uncharacterized protein n=2 Tax=Aegilops tauschii subsp. strangulata TaxID=200361 RepID=A0A452XK61_AEGTS
FRLLSQCQRFQKMVMAVFAYIYHQSFISPRNFSADAILDQILRNLRYEEQRTLYELLGEMLGNLYKAEKLSACL